MLLNPDSEARARIEQALKKAIVNTPPDALVDAVISLINTELQPVEEAILHALDRAAESPSCVNSIERYEDWTGGEPSISTIRNLSRISDAGYTCRNMAITLRGPHGFKR